MNQNAKIDLSTHLKAKTENELRDLAEISLKVGNQLLFEKIAEANPKITQKTAKIFEKDSVFFDICKSGTEFSYSTFMKNRNSNKILDENNNNCMHIAAKYGNVEVGFFFHVALRNNYFQNSF